MTVLAYTLGVLMFVVGVAVSIGLHEVGHLLPGKLFNVKVTQFFVGFGKTLWSTRRGETEYGVKAIPLGGYCKLVGMVPPNPERTGDGGADAPAARVLSRNTGMFAQLVSDAKAAEYEHVGPEDEPRLFYNKPAWKRLTIMGSGVAINIVLAFILFSIVFMGHGAQVPTTSVAAVSECVVAVTAENADSPPRRCSPDDPPAPAREAGFEPGDRFVSINGVPVTDWDVAQREIRANGGETAEIVVERDGRELTLTPTTEVTPRPVDPDDPEVIREVGFLGVVPDSELQRQDVGYVVDVMVDGTISTLGIISRLPVEVYHVGRAAVGLEERDPEGPVSVVGAGRFAGQVAAEDRLSVSDRFFGVLALLAGLNLFLGLVNLVPLPPFDGGGIATTLYESVRRAVARLRGRPDPGGVDSAKLLPVTYVMAAALMVMSVILIYADIVAPVSLS